MRLTKIIIATLRDDLHTFPVFDQSQADLVNVQVGDQLLLPHDNPARGYERHNVTRRRWKLDRQTNGVVIGTLEITVEPQ